MLRVMQDGGSVELMSRVKTYNDSNWHYISIMKDGLMSVLCHCSCHFCGLYRAWLASVKLFDVNGIGNN